MVNVTFIVRVFFPNQDHPVIYEEIFVEDVSVVEKSEEPGGERLVKMRSGRKFIRR